MIAIVSELCCYIRLCWYDKVVQSSEYDMCSFSWEKDIKVVIYQSLHTNKKSSVVNTYEILVVTALLRDFHVVYPDHFLYFFLTLLNPTVPQIT